APADLAPAPAPAIIETDWQPADPAPQPADVPQPVPGDVDNAPVEIHQVANVAYTKRLWDAIRAQDISGNDALDALARPSVLS
ncbi:resuscitation-promoting factor RpfA, partial [Mycobacterium shinjukuense]